MSPVHSPSVPSFRIRRRHVSTTTVGLFPECPEAISPKRMVQGLAPAADQFTGDRKTADLTGDRKAADRSGDSNRLAPACPPASTTSVGSQSQTYGPIRIGSSSSNERAEGQVG